MRHYHTWEPHFVMIGWEECLVCGKERRVVQQRNSAQEKVDGPASLEGEGLSVEENRVSFG